MYSYNLACGLELSHILPIDKMHDNITAGISSILIPDYSIYQEPYEYSYEKGLRFWLRDIMEREGDTLIFFDDNC